MIKTVQQPFTFSADPDVQGSNQTGMRDRNERLVLTILRHRGPLPKAEIARKTGLSAQTVSVIMRALEADGLINKGEKVRGKVGQPSVPMELDPDGAYFFGLKVGRRSTEMVLVDFVGSIVARKRMTYRYPTPSDTLEFTQRTVKELLRSLDKEKRSRVAGLGIASPFFLWEWGAEIGVDESDMLAWRDVDLQAEVSKLFKFPVFLGNDATCACGAELVFGESEKPLDFLYIYVGYFIGGGVVLNGNLYPGSSGNAGAIGPVQILGPNKKNAQLLDIASLIGLEKKFLAEGGNASEMWENPEAWGIDSDVVSAWLKEATPAIAKAIQTAISIIDFSAIVIDGSMPHNVRGKIVNDVTQHLEVLDLAGLTKPRIQPGKIGANARALGAASLPLSRRFMLETLKPAVSN